MPDNAEYDFQTVAVMERWLRRTSNCVDVGCHEGDILSQMLKLAPEGTHFAFEPLPGLYQRLAQRFTANPRVHVSGIALSDHMGESSFQHVISNPGYSGLRRRRYDRPNERIEEIVVRLDLMDHIVPTDVHIAFIKIDVEGAELEVLRGAEETIRRSRPVIVFEHGLGAADYYGTEPEVVYDLLQNAGLAVTLMDRWLVGASPLRCGEFADQFRQGLNYYFMAYPKPSMGGAV